MHELSVMSALLELVEEHAQELGAKRVLTINLVIGERACIIDDSLLFYFQELTPGTLAEGAELMVRRPAMRFHCAACESHYAPAGGDFRCPACRTVGCVTDDGTEILIESMEIET